MLGCITDFVIDRFDKERLRGEVFKLLVDSTRLHDRLECTTEDDDVRALDVEVMLDELEKVEAAANVLVVRARKLVRDRVERVLLNEGK